MKPGRVGLMWVAGQFSDTAHKHDLDANAMFDYAAAHRVDVIGGSEARAARRNTMLDILGDVASVMGYRLLSYPDQDCWLAVDRTFGRGVGRFVPVVSKAPATKTGAHGHGPRGLFTATIVPHESGIGPSVTVAAAHFITRSADPSGRANRLIDREAADLFGEAAAGAALGFLMGDLNVDDEHRDGFSVAPLTTCWDDLGRWPTTMPTGPRGGGPTLDVIARWDRDTRVSLKSAAVIPETALQLHTDHLPIMATYLVRRPADKGTT